MYDVDDKQRYVIEVVAFINTLQNEDSRLQDDVTGTELLDGIRRIAVYATILSNMPPMALTMMKAAQMAAISAEQCAKMVVLCDTLGNREIE